MVVDPNENFLLVGHSSFSKSILLLGRGGGQIQGMYLRDSQIFKNYENCWDLHIDFHTRI